MHAQQATREAQREQAQLREMLQQAVQQLGLAVTPTRSLAGTPEGDGPRMLRGLAGAAENCLLISWQACRE